MISLEPQLHLETRRSVIWMGKDRFGWTQIRVDAKTWIGRHSRSKQSYMLFTQCSFRLDCINKSTCLV